MSLAAAVCCCLFSTQVWAQTGVDDDRVSLPEGPGSLEGVGENIEIDPNMGSMSYAVSINTPGGVNGLSPALGLNYSSAGSSSVVGVGWSLPTMSIERMTMRETPEYNDEDYFAVNGGDELVLIAAIMISCSGHAAVEHLSPRAGGALARGLISVFAVDPGQPGGAGLLVGDL